MDTDGIVNIREFGAFLQNYGRNYAAAQLQYLFNKTDANGNGYIEFSDILTALSTYGKTTRRGMIAQEMDADISQIDINGDGQINSEDFKIMLNLK
ncbi:unnamed protein product [Oikopleura dioica]|uniref:EF-hand domain-containing protein n=1 Tax=Oikopleura dioica TaxID=34765 RepID=E4Y730_OIKDI|nr:unnamed protein product [Oikopleura dioica]